MLLLPRRPDKANDLFMYICTACTNKMAPGRYADDAMASAISCSLRSSSCSLSGCASPSASACVSFQAFTASSKACNFFLSLRALC